LRHILTAAEGSEPPLLQAWRLAGWRKILSLACP